MAFSNWTGRLQTGFWNYSELSQRPLTDHEISRSNLHRPLDYPLRQYFYLTDGRQNLVNRLYHIFSCAFSQELKDFSNQPAGQWPGREMQPNVCHASLSLSLCCGEKEDLGHIHEAPNIYVSHSVTPFKRSVVSCGRTISRTTRSGRNLIERRGDWWTCCLLLLSSCKRSHYLGCWWAKMKYKSHGYSPATVRHRLLWKDPH